MVAQIASPIHFGTSVAQISLTAFGMSVALTALVRFLARRLGAVSQPRSDRWHTTATAMFGGIGIYASVLASLLLLLPHHRDLWVVIGASSALFAVGVIDDVFHIKPYQKLIGQLMGAALIVYFGLVLPWTGWIAINMLITIVWLVGITNAVNMLDNMDGLAAGVSAIAACFLAINFAINGQLSETLVVTAFAGALLGFLVFNRNPASIFMGDCGSMFVGFFLAGTALLSASGGGGRSRSVIAVLAVPVFVLCVPIFDTTFVTLVRKLAGRAASRGGRDHTSHRLVALGLTEKRAVWLLYLLALISGSLGLLARRAALDVSVVAIASFIVILTFIGIHLARVRIYSEEELAIARDKPLMAFLFDLTHKRRIFEVALDVVLISGAYYLAYALRFGPMDSSLNWELFAKTLPVAIFVKLATFLGSGVYRIIWRYAGIENVLDSMRAVAFGSFATILTIVLVFRFDGFSRMVFVVDGLLLFVMLVGSRFAFRLLRRLTPIPHASTGRRVIIYGAGDGGELLLRELNNNAALQYIPVAFIDDDPAKAGRHLHGLPIYSGEESLREICGSTQAQELLLSSMKLPLSRVRAIIAQCEGCGIPVKVMKIDIRRLADADIGWVVPTPEQDDTRLTLASLPAGAPLLTPGPHTIHARTEH